MLQRHIKIALFYFVVAAFFGSTLRFSNVFELDWNSDFILHGHSHIALLGWLYTAITTQLYHNFLANPEADKEYKRLFLFTQFTLAGMLFSFPFQGYSLFSIVLSSLFLISTYWFVSLFLRRTPLALKGTPSFNLAKAALLFLVFSSLGPWALGVIMNTHGSDSNGYQNAIFFYLHFMYNAFFIFAVLSFFFRHIERHKEFLEDAAFRKFYKWLIASAILTFPLSLLWSGPHIFVYVLAGAGVISQIIAFTMFFTIAKQNWDVILKSTSPEVIFVFKLISVLMMLKILLQTISVFPGIVLFLAENKFIVVAYLHWVFLGIITLALFAFLKHYQLMKCSKPTMVFFIVTFFLTEVYLLYGGLYKLLHLPFLPNYAVVLFSASALLFLSVLVIFVNNLIPKRQKNEGR